jgi:hypothetical protein
MLAFFLKLSPVFLNNTLRHDPANETLGLPVFLEIFVLVYEG